MPPSRRNCNANINFFADDTSLSIVVCNLDVVGRVLQSDIDKTDQWAQNIACSV